LASCFSSLPVLPERDFIPPPSRTFGGRFVLLFLTRLQTPWGRSRPDCPHRYSPLFFFLTGVVLCRFEIPFFFWSCIACDSFFFFLCRLGYVSPVHHVVSLSYCRALASLGPPLPLASMWRAGGGGGSPPPPPSSAGFLVFLSPFPTFFFPKRDFDFFPFGFFSNFPSFSFYAGAKGHFSPLSFSRAGPSSCFFYFS